MGLALFIAVICILNCNQLILTATNPSPPPPKTRRTYIVHVEAQSNDLDTYYDSFFATAAGDRPRILHRYRTVFKGFAARLSEDELESMRQKKGFVSAHLDQVYQLLTTHSPSFLGLTQNLGFWNSSDYGKGVIIGILDTGITPDHPSFADQGMPPPPAKWKGKCDFTRGACNNKLIGARRFDDEVTTPADDDGHGTHTASTAGGNFVAGANIFGNANGTAAGIAPLAHVAMYGVCTPDGCSESDILAGMDAAIEDGVDVISMSIGGPSAPFYSDSIAIGAYRAMEKGILVSCAAGNSGPDHQTMSNEAPWILTVGASTIDRKLRSTVVLGNGQELDGESAFQPHDFNSTTEYELFYRGKFCRKGDVNSSEASGRIVVCEIGGGGKIAQGVAVKNAGGAGMILLNSEIEGSTSSADAHVLPASHITFADATKLKAYLFPSLSSVGKARIVFKGTTIGDDGAAPAVAYFSSRGPSAASPGILKPDIIGPGNNILAAWNKSPNNMSAAANFFFNIISGTSMACPHLSGVAALLKSAHPDWSPAAIKSAIMTTADRVNLGGKPIEDERDEPADVFATGAGHVNPSKATDPGLIYDIQPDDYIPYLCGLNYTSKQVSLLVQRQVECSSNSSIPEAELNYPSFSIRVGSTPQTYTRTVTNVGDSNSSYDVKIVAPPGVTATVIPAKLSFSRVGEKLKYSVTFSRSGAGGVKNQTGEGVIEWISSKHSVRTPLALVFA